MQSFSSNRVIYSDAGAMKGALSGAPHSYLFYASHIYVLIIQQETLHFLYIQCEDVYAYFFFILNLNVCTYLLSNVVLIALRVQVI